jgi:hypothetical protein
MKLTVVWAVARSFSIEKIRLPVPKTYSLVSPSGMSFNGPKDVPGAGAWGDLRHSSMSLVMRLASSLRVPTDHTTLNLILFDAFEQGLEVASAEAFIAFTLRACLT